MSGVDAASTSYGLTRSALDGIESAIARAGAMEIMPRFDALREGDVREKTSRFDVVTDADEAAEAAIAGYLRDAFPGAVVIGEESTARHPDLLARIADADVAFIIDPLDGTKNFSDGLPLFGTIVAAVSNDVVIGGVIHDPVTRRSAFALKGNGAWLRDADGGERALRAAAPAPMAQMEGIVGTHFLPEPLKSRVNANRARLGLTTWFRCSAHEYRLIASGRCHVILYNKLMPWDHAAGWLLHREAGGYSAHFDGSAYRPSHTTGGLLCAPDEASWRMVREALFEG